MDSAKKAVDSVAEGVKKVALGANKDKAPKKEKKAKDAGDASAGPLELNPPPDFLQKRLELFDKLKKDYDEELAKRPREPIAITMPDGSVREGTSYETTPGEIAKSISNSLYKRTVVARLDGDKDQLWDLDRPLEKSCKLELLSFEGACGHITVRTKTVALVS